LAERFEATGIKVKLKDELNRRLSPYLETLLFRVTQEALTNVKRHAQAKRVTIHLFYKGGVCLSIKDDGKGFDVNSVSGGLGLCSMREQVSLAGGTFKVNSTPGQGTEVLVEFHLI
jgi:signal transduction histidine kinase